MNRYKILKNPDVKPCTSDEAFALWLSSGWSQPVDTVEQLVAELNRQMGGIKDKHDKFIEEKFEEINAFKKLTMSALWRSR
jgi:hypothetical protein